MPNKARSTWRPAPPAICRTDCTICQGTGWELVGEGSASRARPCSCRALDRLIRMKDRVRIPQRYEHCTLAGYQPCNFSQSRALCEARRFVQKYPEPERDLFLAGGSGVGKTHLAVGVLREIMPKLSDDALFVDFIELSRTVDPGSSGTGLNQASWDRLTSAPVLVLDNFGMTTPRRELVILMERLLGMRWRAQRGTIFTGERVRSALLKSGTADRSSATQVFLSALPPRFLMTLATHVQFVSIVGMDYRSRATVGSPLY